MSERLRATAPLAGGLILLATIAVLVAVALAGPTPVHSAHNTVQGDFSLIHMVHTQSFAGSPVSGTNPWNGARRGIFGYRSIPCTGNAPVNNIASDLPSYGTRVRGSRAPSSMRAHPFNIKVRSPRPGQHPDSRELVGAIHFTVCKLGPGATPNPDPIPDRDKPKIFVRFSADTSRPRPESIDFTGRFRITGGTQRYAGLEGAGEISGYLFCFAPEGCAARGGKYLDGQFSMQGNYRDPTPDLREGPG